MERSLMKGNEALAESAIRAGCKCYFGYPITPQNEIGAYLSKRMPKIGGVFLQAESEVGAINMIYGCASTGTRCMTSSSSPGISLKTEGISYLAGADLPCVIVNVQRGGPGLGSIQPSQADYWQMTRALGHGDFFIPVFAPSTVQEMVDMTGKAFDLADKYRTPVVIIADGLLGQMMEPVSFPADGDSVGGTATQKEWAVSGHGGKRKKNVSNSLYLEPEALEKCIKERFDRYKEIIDNHSQAVGENTEDADIVIAAYGSTARIAQTAAEMARAEGLKVGTFRPLTLFPFPKKQLSESCGNCKKVLVVEMSMGQMVDDVRMALEYKLPVEFFGRTGGFVPSPKEVLGKIKEMEVEL